MQRRTKIVCTLGPASDDVARLQDLINAGMDVARLNFSHGDQEAQRRRVKNLREAAALCGRNVGLMGDLQGPKIRVQRFANGSVDLREGAAFFLDSALGLKDGTADGVGVAYPSLSEDVVVGDTLLLNDGLITLAVTKIEKTRVHTKVVIGGILSDHKGVNKRGGGLSAPALTDKDREDLKLAAELGVDFLAVSFVSCAEDVIEARRLLREAGSQSFVVAKIERAEAMQCIDEIIDAADVVMVARGDLGVEMGYAELTGIQKGLIRKTRAKNKIVITATQMMESMIKSPIPTRAEVSDVSNAVMDGTDAVMLSAETAVGSFPVEAVKAMSDVCTGAEKYALPRGRATHRMDDYFTYVDEAIAMAVMYTANHLSVKAIIALTESGSTTRWMSRIRSDIPIYAFTPHEATRRRVSLYRGVYPVAFEIVKTNVRDLYAEMFSTLLSNKLVKVGDLVIFTKGDLSGVSGGTNGMRIVRVTAPDEGAQ